MGPSGAGKSSFLDILAGKEKRGDLEGTLVVDGQRVSKSQYRRMIGYVDQEDLLVSFVFCSVWLASRYISSIDHEHARWKP